MTESDDPSTYAAAVAAEAIRDLPMPYWAARGDKPSFRDETEYGIEVGSGYVHGIGDEFAAQIESLPDYAEGRIVTRKVTYGPWRYVIPEEFEDD
ncbi:hypothetical protein [Mycolicibacterium llatzerense]|uniref:hypothetical protein n=1 Tax=Mycolicibacterium llatzerense TaxID=280871 RepID=UPI0021B69E9B|nr:hypothetical protein [Mycolicibacterium llatzerense]MCT7361317.1 hypothetical protein [Mycolicibacterium llatzerense]